MNFATATIQPAAHPVGCVCTSTQARRGVIWIGEARQARQARQAWLGMDRPGMAEHRRPGQASRGEARRGTAGVARLGSARPGEVRHRRQGVAWRGMARPGMAGVDWHGRLGTARPGVARLGRHGEAGRGTARLSEARQARHKPRVRERGIK